MALRLCLNNSKFLPSFRSLGNVKYLSNYKTDDKIVLTDDGSTIICWHPEPTIPYEFTKPLPETTLEESKSILKLNWGPELKQMFKKKHPDLARQELMSLTFTTKHRWYPRARDKRAKKTPMDRPYL